MKNLHIWLLVALLIGGGALMACKSSKKSTTPTATKSSSATTVSNATTVATTPSATGGNTSAALATLVGKAATKEVKAAYTYTSTAAGTTTNGSFTLYSKPPDWRADFTISGATVTFISTGGKTYECTAQGGTGTCLPSPTTSALPFLTLFTDPASLSAVIGSDVNHSTKTVAGQNADCYSGTAAGAPGEVCFSSDGVLLSITTNSAGTEFTLAATSVSGTVSASDLALPYPVLGAP